MNLQMSSNGYIEGTIDNYSVYVQNKNKFKKDEEKHTINMKDINSFPKPETLVKVIVGCGYPREVVAKVGVTGISWLWDVKEDSEYKCPCNEFLQDGQTWNYIS